jgi:ABC-2 type transport system permease protein
MRKTLVIAAREYNAAVRTKAFIISLLMMPLLMGGSIAVQTLLRDRPDTEEKTFAVLDRTSGRQLGQAIQKAVEQVQDPETKFWKVRVEEPAGESPEALEALSKRLTEEVRKGKLYGFVDIGKDVLEKPVESPAALDRAAEIVYESSRITERRFGEFVQKVVSRKAREERAQRLLKSTDSQTRAEVVKELEKDVPLRFSGLLAAFVTPFGLLMLMFMVVLMTATPLMQGVVEEKMQRIAEVLLGSVQPFELMLGKLLGMAAVSLTISAVYLSGGWWALHHYGLSDALQPSLLAWFVAYQALAALMYGSLFAAVGAACTDMKETQTMMWPVMLLVMVPIFLINSVIQEPNGQLVTALSLFPFATPMLMVARMAVPPGVQWWQPWAGVAGVLAMTLLCVWAAGRIFRVGILMQGKGARIGEIARWVFRG